MSEGADSTHDDSGLPTVDQLLEAFHRTLGHLIRCVALREAIGGFSTPQELARSFESAARDIGEMAGSLQKFSKPPAINRNAPTAEEEEFLRAMVAKLSPDNGPIVIQPREERVQ
jgi:hypothetical protein